MCLASAFAEEGKDGPACVPRGKSRNADCTVRPGGRHSRQVERLACKPIYHAALRTAVFFAGKRSTLRWHVQRAPSGIAAHCIGTCSALHIPARFCSFAKRVAPARLPCGICMKNERHKPDQREASDDQRKASERPTNATAHPLPLQYFVAHSHLSWPGDLYKSREKANFASAYT